MKRKLLCLIILIPYYSIFSIEWKTELKKCFITESSISLGSYEYGNIYKRENNILQIKYNLERFFKPGDYFTSSYYENSELPDSLEIFF